MPTAKAPSRAGKSNAVYVAVASGVAQHGKDANDVATYTKGVTRVRAGHWLLKAVPDAFEPTDDHVHYETATNEPTEG